MKLNKEIRQLSRKMLQASFTDGQLDPGRIASLVDSVIAEKPRNYIDVLKNYKRLLRLEVEKRHATIETASQVDPAIRSEIATNLKSKYGDDLTTDFHLIHSFLAECVSAWEAMFGTEACATASNVFNKNFNQNSKP